jgi:two-component system, NarL family, invasion response regulator UvrY
MHMSPEQLKQLLSDDSETTFRSELDVLDERELEVFSILGQGYSASQVQAEIGVAPPEFRVFKQRIQKKLGLRTEAELLRKAVQHVNP